MVFYHVCWDRLVEFRREDCNSPKRRENLKEVGIECGLHFYRIVFKQLTLWDDLSHSISVRYYFAAEVSPISILPKLLVELCFKTAMPIGADLLYQCFSYEFTLMGMLAEGSHLIDLISYELYLIHPKELSLPLIWHPVTFLNR